MAERSTLVSKWTAALLTLACACALMIDATPAASASGAQTCTNARATPRRELPAALKAISAQRLIGEGDLWTTRPRRPLFTVGEDGWTRLKQPWFRLDDGDLTIDARRVDGGSGSFRADVPPMEAYPRNLNLAIGPGFIPSGLEFSTGGCWKVTARFRDSKVVLYLAVTRAAPGR